MKDYYRILGVPSSATEEGIKKAFRELIRKYHPDKNASAQAKELAYDIIEAYKILTDIEAKMRYDRIYYSYFGYQHSSHPKQNTHQKEASERRVPEDPILQKWIRAAQRQAKTELDNLIKDLPKATVVAIKGAFQQVVYYVLCSIVLYILLNTLISK